MVRKFLLAAAAVVVILFLYLVAYRYMGRTNNALVFDVKYYHYRWQAWLFWPAAKLETEIRDKSVVTTVEGEAVFIPGRPSDPGYLDLTP